MVPILCKDPEGRDTVLFLGLPLAGTEPKWGDRSRGPDVPSCTIVPAVRLQTGPLNSTPCLLSNMEAGTRDKGVGDEHSSQRLCRGDGSFSRTLSCPACGSLPQLSVSETILVTQSGVPRTAESEK